MNSTMTQNQRPQFGTTKSYDEWWSKTHEDWKRVTDQPAYEYAYIDEKIIKHYLSNGKLTGFALGPVFHTEDGTRHEVMTTRLCYEDLDKFMSEAKNVYLYSIVFQPQLFDYVTTESGTQAILRFGNVIHFRGARFN